jgi:predicted ATPase
MKPVDVPQADSLSRVRELVQTVEFGAVDTAKLQLVMTLHPRHVGYHIHAARVLGWLERIGEDWAVASRGAELLQTGTGSQEERAVFRKSINESEHLKAIAPDLLGDEEPEQDLLANKIQEVVGMSPATARRRASTLLRWRTQSLPTRPRRIETFVFDDDAAIKESVRVHAIHVERFGLLRSVRVEMGENPVLVGDNGTGKSTLFDVFKFIEDALADGVSSAIERRGNSLSELLWFGEGEAFGFAIEFSLPKRIRFDHARARYELEVGQLDEGGVGVRRESFYLMPREAPEPNAVQQATPRGWRKVFGLTQNGQARYGSEDPVSRKTTTAPVGNDGLGLARLPDDPDRFVAASRVRSLLMGGVRLMNFDPAAVASPCSVDSAPVLESDGRGFARVAHGLSTDEPDRYGLWIRHVSEAIPAIEGIEVREDAGSVSLNARMRGGLELPLSRLSSGCLRVLGATLIPYQSEADTLFVVESPEQGIHPKGIEAFAQALSDGSDTQVIVTTYSPAWVGSVPLERIRCFVREAGGVRVVPGTQVELVQGGEGPVAMPHLFSAGFMS